MNAVHCHYDSLAPGKFGCNFYPRPVLAFGYCRCLRVCVCVCLSVNHHLVRAVTHQPFKLESPNLDQRCKRSLATPGRWNTNLSQCNPRVTCGRTPLTWDRFVQVFGHPPTHFTSPDWYLTSASTVVEHNINTLWPETHFEDETRKSPLTRPDTHSATADLLVDPVFSQW